MSLGVTMKKNPILKLTWCDPTGCDCVSIDRVEHSPDLKEFLSVKISYGVLIRETKEVIIIGWDITSSREEAFILAIPQSLIISRRMLK